MKNRNLFPMERNRYFHGKMLTARDFEVEQKYFNDKRRLMNRCVVGAGVVCGLGVYRNDDTSLSIETGLALDYAGREIAISSPIIRKLQMIDGFETLPGHEQAWLCLGYDEQLKESVNNIGVPDSESRQFNKIEESYHLYLDTSEPDMDMLFGDSGGNRVQTLYAGKDFSLHMVIPTTVMADIEFPIRFIIVKGAGLPPLSFKYSFKSEYVRSEDSDTITVQFNEDRNSQQDIYMLDYNLKAVSVSDMQVPFGRGNALLSLSMGDFTDQAEIVLKNEIYICGSRASYEHMLDIGRNSLESRLTGSDTPIYLAKIDYVSAGSTHILRQVKTLPFEQRVANGRGRTENSIISGPSEKFPADVTTEVEMLKYWQKPEVAVNYNQQKKSMEFHFGLPSSEAYDYATSSGVVEVPLSGAIRVNARFVSDEIPHNLGIGYVSLSFAVEFGENDNRKLLFGNGDIFSSKSEGKEVPKVEVAGILYPDTGTFKIGVRCLDHVEGHFLRVRWFAYKATRDTADMRSRDVVTVSINPDIHKMKVRERMHFEAEVNGTADKGVIWNVPDADSGKIDQDGLYQAPSKPGTYEITAVSRVDQDARASAFAIVEE